MSAGDKINRREFFSRFFAFTLGCLSAATGIFAVLKGKKIDPFLSMDASSIVRRLGLGRDLLEDLNFSISTEMKYASHIAKLKIDFETKSPNGVLFSDFLRKSAEEDFKNNRVVFAKNWILSETEIAVFLYNKLQRLGLIKQ